MPSGPHKNGDPIVILLKRIVTNQAGPEVVEAGDGERSLWRKILINQVAGKSL